MFDKLKGLIDLKGILMAAGIFGSLFVAYDKIGIHDKYIYQHWDKIQNLGRVRISTLHNETEKISLLNSNTYKGAFLCLVTYSHLP